jgi:hypothetical protein
MVDGTSTQVECESIVVGGNPGNVRTVPEGFLAAVLASGETAMFIPREQLLYAKKIDSGSISVQVQGANGVQVGKQIAAELERYYSNGGRRP